MKGEVTAIVLAGGKGSRLQPVVNDIPKPMAPVAGRPFLAYILDFLRHHGIQKTVLSVGYKADKIADHFQSSHRGMGLVYAHEEAPLGTGGAVRNALSFCATDEVLVMNGDSFLDFDLSAFLSLNLVNGCSALVLQELIEPDRYGTVRLNENGRITEFCEKQRGLRSGLVNMGIYRMSTKALDHYPIQKPFSLEQDFFRDAAPRGSLVSFIASGYFIDIGVPEDYARAQSDFKHFRYA